MDIALAILFSLFGIGCLFSVIVGAPGTWVLVGVAVLAELLDERVLGAPDDVTTFGWSVLGWAAGLALLGEAIEAGAGAVGARMGGASRRGMLGALVGGLVGAIVLTPILAIPVLGTLVGAAIGTFVGAWIGESTSPAFRSRADTFRASFSAVIGSLAGRLGKLVPGIVAWAILVRAAFA